MNKNILVVTAHPKAGYGGSGVKVKMRDESSMALREPGEEWKEENEREEENERDEERNNV